MKSFIVKGLIAILSIVALCLGITILNTSDIESAFADEEYCATFLPNGGESRNIDNLSGQSFENGVLTILKDLQIEQSITLSGSVGVLLGENIITYTGDSFAFIISDDATVSISASGGGVTTLSVEPHKAKGLIKFGLRSDVTISGGEYSGETEENYSLFYIADNVIPGSAVNGPKANGGTINLVNVTASSNYAILSSNYDYWTYFTLNVSGGIYTRSNESSGTFNEKTFTLLGVNSTFDGVKITSNWGPCVEVVGIGKVDGGENYTTATFKGNNIFTATHTQNTWYNTALAVSNDGYVEIQDGSYSGIYGFYTFSSGGHVKITGGEFSGKNSAIKTDMDITYKNSYGYSASMDIDGGVFYGDVVRGQGSSDINSIYVLSGTFTTDVEQFIRNGKEVVYTATVDDSGVTYFYIVTDEGNAQGAILPENSVEIKFSPEIEVSTEEAWATIKTSLNEIVLYSSAIDTQNITQSISNATGVENAKMVVDVSKISILYNGLPSIEYEVHPVDADDNIIANQDINGRITFCLPMPSTFNAKYVQVYHTEFGETEGCLMGVYPIKEESSVSFVTLSSNSFSKFSVSAIDGYSLDPEAIVGVVGYQSVEDAVNAIESNQNAGVIHMCKDSVVGSGTQGIVISSTEVSIDLNGFTITALGDYAFCVQNGGVLNIDGSTEGSQIASGILCEENFTSTGSLNISGGIYTNSAGFSIVILGDGTFNIEKATISGPSGIYFVGGELNIRNTTITATGESINQISDSISSTGDGIVFASKVSSSGTSTINLGQEVQISSQNGYAIRECNFSQNLESEHIINIYGGVYYGVLGDLNISDNTALSLNVNIRGGIFSKPLKDVYCAEGYKPSYRTSEGYYTVNVACLLDNDGHHESDTSIGLEILPATCEHEGIILHICLICNEAYIISVPKLEHNYHYVGGSRATQTSPGQVEHYHCDECGHDFDLAFNQIDSIYTGFVGSKGSNGRNGQNGQNGRDGATWYCEEGLPSATLGVDGDLCLDSLSSNVYQKINGNWQYVASIKGSAGISGEKGEQGLQGERGINGQDGKDGKDQPSAVSMVAIIFAVISLVSTFILLIMISKRKNEY